MTRKPDDELSAAIAKVTEGQKPPELRLSAYVRANFAKIKAQVASRPWLIIEQAMAEIGVYDRHGKAPSWNAINQSMLREERRRQKRGSPPPERRGRPPKTAPAARPEEPDDEPGKRKHISTSKLPWG